MRSVAASALLCFAAIAPWACSSASPQCAVGADCASGICESNGRCAPLAGGHADAGVTPSDAGVVADDGAANDGAPPPDDAPMTLGDTGSPFPGVDGGICVPNNDGTIERAEVPMQAGLHANFEYAENVTVDSAGAMNADGTFAWDLTGPYSGDHTVLVTTDALTGQWFASQFPSATYTTKLSDTSDLLGIFQGSQIALSLVGVVSPSAPDSGSGYTDVQYTPAALVLGVPMTLGTTWSSNSNITGTALGTPTDYTETYASKVDARGTLKIPYGTFKVLRVQTTLSRYALGIVTVYRSFSFVAECAGTIASLTSQPDETTIEFTNAAQVQRLTP